MDKIIYSKFNSTRRLDFQVGTYIMQGKDEKYVRKVPLSLEAEKHLLSMLQNADALKRVYRGIQIVPCQMRADGLLFEYKKGTKLISDSSFEGKYADLVKRIREVIQIIFSVSDDNVETFCMTPNFEEMFPGCNPGEVPAYKVTNLDSIASNFLIDGDSVWCLDYEWVFDFDIPVAYAQYRVLLYIYKEHLLFFENKGVDLDKFLSEFAYSTQDIELFNKMEYHFQEYVHGKNIENIYLENYKKRTTTIADMQELISAKDVHIRNIETVNRQMDASIHELTKDVQELSGIKNEQTAIIQAQQQYIEKVRKAIKNPFFGAYCLLKKTAKRVCRLLKAIRRKVVHKLFKKGTEPGLQQKRDNEYEKWICEVEKTETYEESFTYKPCISVLVPVYNVLDKHLEACIQSVQNQVYDNWELCLVDDCSTWENVRKTLEKYSQQPKIKVIYRETNGHISACTNTALNHASGEFVAFMDCDDVLRPNALYEVVKLLNCDSTLDFIYSDEDKIDEDGQYRHSPNFKPEWSPDTFMSLMYTCHLGVYRRQIACDIGGLRSAFDGAQDYDFTLRFTEKTNKIGHIPKVLYHWRERTESTAINPEAKPYIMEASKRCKEEALVRRGLQGTVELVDGCYQFRVNYQSKTNPLVSIIIPSKDNYKILKRCIDSLYEKTQYRNFEVVLVDNGSNHENKLLYQKMASDNGINYIYTPMSFNFSAMCNIGAKNAKGDYFLFLNDDIEIIDGEWLGRMEGHAELSYVGAVGAKLLYPKTRNIQHIGVLNIANGPSHAYANYNDTTIYPFCRNRIDYNYSAVTAACLMVNREKYYRVNGFTEELPVAYNDVDFCFKLVEAGYYNVVRNDAVLLHHESVSRGDDAKSKEKMQRLLRERNKLYEMHPYFVHYDPFYSENLTQSNVDFSINFLLGKDTECKLETTNVQCKNSSRLRANVDRKDIGATTVIEGWAFIPHMDYQPDVKIYLNGKSHSFSATSYRVNRKDVQETFNAECSSSMVGFRTEFDAGDIPDGKYRIGVICGEESVLTDDYALFGTP